MILDEKTTKELEDDMEEISERKKSEAEVLEQGKKMLLNALETFDKNMQQVSNDLKVGFMEASILGKCPKCGTGDLIIRHSRIGKQFVACTNYPKCTNTYPLVQKAKIVPTGRVCEYCHTPIVKVIRKGMRPFEMDLDPQCPNRPVTFRSKSSEEGQKAEQKTPQTPQKEESPEPKKAAKKAAKPKAIAPKRKAKKAPQKKKTQKKSDKNKQGETNEN